MYIVEVLVEKGRWWHFLWPIHHPIAHTWFLHETSRQHGGVEPSTPHHNSNIFFSLSLLTSRWRGRNHLSYLRAKSHYDSQPGEASEHPLIYDDANIHFYRGNNAYLLEPGNRQRCPASMSAIGLLPQSASTGMVRDTSGLSQQVGLLA